MKLKYILINTIFFIFLASTSFAAYDDSGTDYSNKSSDKWIQDRAGDGLRMVNSFVCIFKNANGYTRPNTTWKVLIDEVKCGLQDASEAGSGAVSYATATIVSTRANDTSNQEMKAYFEAANADKYVSTVSLNSVQKVFTIY